MNSTEYPKFFQVIVNIDKCHCIWPVAIGLPVPDGWQATGFTGPMNSALVQVADRWQNQIAAVERGEPDASAPAES